MWVFTKDGFYSIVSKDCQPNEVQIKTRSELDLHNLCNKLNISPPIIKEEFDGYPYRTIINKNLWISYLTDYVNDIDYDNVRNHIIDREDNQRKDAYKKVWKTMYNWMGISSNLYDD